MEMFLWQLDYEKVINCNHAKSYGRYSRNNISKIIQQKTNWYLKVIIKKLHMSCNANIFATPNEQK